MQLSGKSRRGRIRLFAARHSGHRHERRRDLHPSGSLRQGRRLPRRERREVRRRRTRTEGTRRSHTDVFTRRAAGFPECGPRQGAQAERRSECRLPDAADFHGRLLRQLLQPVRPPVAGLRAGRGRLPHERRSSRAVLREKQRRRDGAAQRRHKLEIDQRPRIHDALQSLSFRANQCHARARLQVRPGNEGDGRGLQGVHAERDGLRLPA